MTNKEPQRGVRYDFAPDRIYCKDCGYNITTDDNCKCKGTGIEPQVDMELTPEQMRDALGYMIGTNLSLQEWALNCCEIVAQAQLKRALPIIWQKGYEYGKEVATINLPDLIKEATQAERAKCEDEFMELTKKIGEDSFNAGAEAGRAKVAKEIFDELDNLFSAYSDKFHMPTIKYKYLKSHYKGE